MKKHTSHFFVTIMDGCIIKLLFIMILSFCCSSLSAQITYKLVQVTSVSAGGLYVFEQDGYVMSNSISSNALTTTNSFSTTGLTGNESYIWTLEIATGGFKMKNVSVSKYLANSSSTSLSLESKSKDASIWSFNIDGTAIIQNVSNDNRYLGYTAAASYVYKAYGTSSLSSSTYPHAIRIYQLQSEKSDANTKWYMDNSKSEELTYIDINKLNGAGPFYLDTKSSGAKTYESSDTEVATIDEIGNITLVKYGTTVITATVAEDETYNGSTASFVLTVADEYVDVLNYYNIGNSTNLFAEFSGLVGCSGALYKGYTSGMNKTVRLNTDFKNSILTTGTAGVVKRIEVKWNSSTTDERTITVYGKNTAYSNLDASGASLGTPLGTIVKGTSTEINLVNNGMDYAFIDLAVDDVLSVDYIVIEWESAIITLSEAGKGYKTFCYSKPLDFSGVSGLTAYVATVEDGIAIFEPVEGSVPANTGLLLYGEANTVYNVPCVLSSNTDVSGNVLVGVTEATNVGAGIYVLMNVEGNVAFYRTSNTFEVGANSAYIPSGVSASKALTMSFVGVPTIINNPSEIRQIPDTREVMYNIAGQIVGEDYKGFVVKGGKKYLYNRK